MYDWEHIDLLLSIEAKIRSYPKLKDIHTAVMQELEGQEPMKDPVAEPVHQLTFFEPDDTETPRRSL